MEKIDSNWELFSCCCHCCTNAISRRPRDDDDNDEDIECEFCEELFHSLSLHYVLIILALPSVCVCVESLKIELWNKNPIKRFRIELKSVYVSRGA